MSLHEFYPPGWPRCACGLPVMDGHLTCGRLECDERGARERYAREWREARERGRLARVEMELHDGRVIDLAGLTAEEAVQKIRALGIRSEDIKVTRHVMPHSLAELRRRAQERRS